MITLDLDIAYLCSRYNIAATSIQQYKKSNLSIEQIAQIEAEKGNAKAAELLTRITSNPNELANLFQLVNPSNRYLILSNMNQQDLLMIIQYLEPDEMILGLSIFNFEILIQLMMKMDIEALAEVVLNTLDSDKFLQILPEEFLNEFLASNKLNREILMQAMENIDEEQLQKMMENYSGQSCYDSRDNILLQLSQMSDEDFMNSVFMFELQGKQQIISNVLQKNPDLFTEFSKEAMVFPFQQMKKEDVLKSLSILKTKDMMPMIEQMPREILSIIATQIDPRVFSQILCSEFADVIAKCGIKL